MLYYIGTFEPVRKRKPIIVVSLFMSLTLQRLITPMECTLKTYLSGN